MSCPRSQGPSSAITKSMKEGRDKNFACVRNERTHRQTGLRETAVVSCTSTSKDARRSASRGAEELVRDLVSDDVVFRDNHAADAAWKMFFAEILHIFGHFM